MERPSGIPHRLDTEFTAFEDVDFAEALDGMPYRTGGLCTLCSKIDFAAFFDFLKPQNPSTISLSNAIRQSDSCVFCCAVATAAAKRPALLEAALQRELECDVRPWKPKGWTPNDDQYYPYLEIFVWVKSSRNPEELPWFPERLRNPRTGGLANVDLEFLIDDPLLILERTGSKEAGPFSLSWRHQMPNALVSEGDCDTTDGSIQVDHPSIEDIKESIEDDDSDFEEAYKRENTSVWRNCRIRRLLGSAINFDLVTSEFKVSFSGNKPNVLENTAFQSSLGRLINASRMRLVNVLNGNLEIISEPRGYIALS